MEQQRLDHGWNRLPSTEIPLWRQVVSLLLQPMALMMWIAAVIEALIENYPDMTILLFIIFTNASISFYEMRKSGNAVAALQGQLKPKARVKRRETDGELGQWKEIDAEELVPGDTVLLASGSAVPADCRIERGVITVDQAALTGESLPVKIDGHSDEVLNPLMGTMVMTGEVEAAVQYTGSNTVLGQAASLLDRPEETSNLDKILFKIVMIMAGLSVALSFIVFLFGLYKEEGFHETLSFTVVLIIASIPMAVEIVTTTTLALGARTLAIEGAIVTRLSSVEDMAAMNVLCSDKTGTLTLNEMKLHNELVTFGEHDGASRTELQRDAIMATKWNEPPGDAIDTMLLESEESLKIIEDLKSSGVVQTDFMPFDPSVKRTEATIEKDGVIFKVTKGAPDVIIDLCTDTSEVKQRARSEHEKFAARGIRCLAIAKTDSAGAWRMNAMLTFMDPARPDSKDTIANATKLGVPVRMITGDHLLIAKETCRQLELPEGVIGVEQLHGELGREPSQWLDEKGNAPRAVDEETKTRTELGKLIEEADGFAQVFPTHKYIIVDVLRQLGYKCGMTGDGVNDAAAMKVADVGVCVKGGTDAARAAADIVLTEPGLSTIVNGIKLSRKIFARINNFMCYRLAASMQLLLYFFVAVLTIHPSHYDGEVGTVHDCDTYSTSPSGHECQRYMYGMPVLLLMLITLLNDGALITIAYDNVEGSPQPTAWNIKKLFLVSFVMAAVACGSSLLLLHWALDSWREDSVWQSIGLNAESWGHVTTLMYLKVSISDFLTLFSCRAGDQFWFQSRPAPIVALAAFVALGLSTVIACVIPAMELDGMEVEGLLHSTSTTTTHNVLAPLWVWAYCIVWWWIQDGCKVLVYRICSKYNIFGTAAPKFDYSPLLDVSTDVSTQVGQV